ncbi:putative hydrolase, alpha/beta fold protein [Deltaproteobacteria bacterium]|nr:putative hydrolase, alpha/beta fold protein [Deltaproteobacteria bacterium]
MDALSTRPVRSGLAVADDGIHLYWRAVGEGPAIVCNNGVGVSTFFWRYTVDQFSDRHTVLTWDYRGHGRSDPLPDPTTGEVGMSRHSRDMLAVMDAAGIDKALICGHSMGCQVGLEAWRAAEGRITAYVLILGTAGRALESFADNPRSPFFFNLAGQLIAALGERTHRLVRPILHSPVAWIFTRRAKLVDPMYASKADMAPYLEHLAVLDMRMFIRTVLQMQEHDAWDVLGTIKVPVLIVGAERDAFTPIRLSKDMARRIPGAELLVLADASHAAIIEQPETINHRIERFLRERSPAW